MNEERFRQVLEQIENHPETWDQTDWHSDCGTAHCFAGWAQILSGAPIVKGHARRDARIYLDLSRDEADYYFNGDRTLEDFREALTYNREGYNRAGYDCEGLDTDNQPRPSRG